MLKTQSDLRQTTTMKTITVIVPALLLALAATPAAAIIKPIEAGPIANAQEAQRKCPAIAQQNNGSWTGKWWGIASGNMAVCEVDARKNEYNAGGFIANQQQANQMCPRIAAKYRAQWKGEWRVTIPNRMATCKLSFGSREVDVGFIRNQQEANLRCKAAALRENSKWDGTWRTQGNTSFCRLED